MVYVQVVHEALLYSGEFDAWDMLKTVLSFVLYIVALLFIYVVWLECEK